MSTESLADFARRRGVNKSTVTRWAKAGRLVLDGNAVQVEKSLDLLAATAGYRADVARRHQLEREERDSAASAGPGLREQLRLAALEKARNEGRIKAAQADKLEMERDELAGNLVRRADVDYVLDDYGALLRRLLAGRAERQGAELGLSADQITALAEADDNLLAELAAALKARATAQDSAP